MTKPMSVARLSRAQREVLTYAIGTENNFGHSKPAGRLPNHGFHSPASITLGILVLGGWVEEDLYIRDAQERRVLETQRTEKIEAAKVALADGEWVSAFDELKRARDIQPILDRKAYWVTDAGKEAIQQTQEEN